MAGSPSPDVGKVLEELERERERIRREVEREYGGREAGRKIEEFVRRYLASSGLNKVLLIDFMLPSADLKSRLRVTEGGKVVTKIRQFEKGDIERVSTLRSRFYQILRSNGAFKIGEKTWAILPGFEGKLVKQANEKLEELNRIIGKYGFPPRRLDLIEIYTPTKWVMKKLAENIAEYEASIRDIQEKLKNKEIEEREKRLLANKLSKLARILDSLKRQYEQLEKLEKERASKYLRLETGEKEKGVTAETAKREEGKTVEEKKENVLYEVKGEYVPIVLSVEGLPSGVKDRWITVYTGLKTKKYKKGTWLVADKRHITYKMKNGRLVDNLREGSIVRLYYVAGSRRHDTNKYDEFFIVKKGVKSRVTLKDLIDDHDITVELENLEKLPKLTRKEYNELEAWLKNRGLKPSLYDPVVSLYDYWIRKKLGEQAKQAKQAPATEERLGEVRPEELQPIKFEAGKQEEKAARYLRL